MGLDAGALPAFPWDTLGDVKDRAAAHPGGVIDLSIGTPVDPTPACARAALAGAADAPGYPPTIGTPELRGAIAAWWARRRGASAVAPGNVLPLLGTKELVALLPALLGLGPGDTVVHPAIAYPTYDVGARLAGAAGHPGAGLTDWPDGTRLVWLNSPGNPDGHVLDARQLRQIVAAARERGVVVVADECYAELPFAEPYRTSGVPSLLADAVTGGDLTGLLAVYSLSKQSNLAGYRAGFLTGDAALVGALTEVRKHAGFMVPAPVQAAMVAVLSDDEHVAAQNARYARRREVLTDAVCAFGLIPDPDSAAGLYIWARREDAPCSAAASRELTREFAERGILVAPGSFYGDAGGGYVRIALSATDEQIAAAAARLR